MFIHNPVTVVRLRTGEGWRACCDTEHTCMQTDGSDRKPRKPTLARARVGRGRGEGIGMWPATEVSVCLSV